MTETTPEACNVCKDTATVHVLISGQYDPFCGTHGRGWIAGGRRRWRNL